MIMDLFQHRYYRLNKTFMTILGQWPYQSARTRRAIQGLVIFGGLSGFVPQVLACVKYRDDWRIVLDCVIPCLFVAMFSIKFIGFLWNSEKTLKLFDRILTNWQVWAQDREINIIHEYSEQGKRMAIGYTDLSILLKAVIYSTVILYTTEPMLPKIIDVILRNGTEIGKFPYPVDYHYFDAQKYYYCIMMHFYMCACVAAMGLIASDAMLIICVQHVCGVFAAMGFLLPTESFHMSLRCKLEQMGSNGTSVEKIGIPFGLKKRNFINLATFIDRHNDAIEYANLIDATYTWSFLFTIGIGLIMINILGLQILMRTDDPESTIKFIAIVMSLEMVFYTECYISQILEDHSINIGHYIHNSRWYRLSPSVQKVLQLMSMRCRVPCQLTAGRMLIMSLRTFGLTFRTAMSYFAVVRSMDDSLNTN